MAQLIRHLLKKCLQYICFKEKDGILKPEAIADTYWFVHTQHRSAWTHELDFRPYMEKF